MTFGSTLRVCATNVRSASGLTIAALIWRCSSLAATARPRRLGTRWIPEAENLISASLGLRSTPLRILSSMRTTAASENVTCGLHVLVDLAAGQGRGPSA